MKPNDRVKFLEKFDLSFEYFDIEYFPQKGEELEQLMSELQIIGKITFIEQLEGKWDDKRRNTSIILHFEDQKFYLKETTYYVWGNFNGREYFEVEPVSTKVVFGNEKKI
jgi:hypothetical protein